MLSIAHFIKSFERFPPDEALVEIITMLRHLDSIVSNDSSRAGLIQLLRKKLNTMMVPEKSFSVLITNTEALIKLKFFYDTLVMLAEMSPLNGVDDTEGKLLDPVLLDIIPADKIIYLSTGYAYNIDGLAQWVNIKKVDPLTNQDLRQYDVDLIESFKSGSPLLIAVQQGDLVRVRALLEKGQIDPNQADSDGKTPLFIASKNGYIDIVRVLLTVPSIDVNQARSSGATPFYIACEKGHLDIVNVLLDDKRIEPSKRRLTGGTALHVAAEAGHADVVSKLLTLNSMPPNLVNNEGATPLMMASQTGALNVVNVLLNTVGINFNQRSHQGRSAFFLAVRHHRTNIVRVLLNVQGINVHQGISNDRTPLAVAGSEDNSNDILTLLLDHYFNQMLREPNPVREAFLSNLLLLDELVKYRDLLWMKLRNLEAVCLKSDEGMALLNTIYKSRTAARSSQHPLYMALSGDVVIIEQIGAMLSTVVEKEPDLSLIKTDGQAGIEDTVGLVTLNQMDGEEHDFRQGMVILLNDYINRIKDGAADESLINFKRHFHGFFGLGINSMAVNRMANYELAKDLVRQIENNRPLNTLFTSFADLGKKRMELMAQYRPESKDYFLKNNHGMNSAQLNGIIEKGLSFVRPSSPPSSSHFCGMSR